MSVGFERWWNNKRYTIIYRFTKTNLTFREAVFETAKDIRARSNKEIILPLSGGIDSTMMYHAGGSWLGDNWQSNASKAGSFNVPFLCSYTGTGASVSFHLTLQGKNNNVTCKLYDSVWKLTENVVATQLTGG